MQAGRRAEQHLEHDLHPGAQQLHELAAAEPGELARRARGAACREDRADLGELGAQDREVEGLLRAVMIVAGGQVDLGARGDVADLGAVEAALGEEGGGGAEEAVLGGARAGRGHEQTFKTSVRPTQAVQWRSQYRAPSSDDTTAGGGAGSRRCARW